MNRITINVNYISQVLEYYNRIKVYRSETETGSYVEITTVLTRIELLASQEHYFYSDITGTRTQWYKTSYYNLTTLAESDMSDARLGGTEDEKIGYTFGNYVPPPGEWGKVYTADDMRYTMLFGIDCIGSDIASSTFSDEQFDQAVLEAVGEFETLLTCDIRRKIYKTFEAEDNRASLNRSRLWREGVDYTHLEDPYEFDTAQWQNFSFFQLRHYPIISIERAVWYSPVKGEIMDMVANHWLRLTSRNAGQIQMYPRDGLNYGPYSVYGPLWSQSMGGRYPGAMEFDYTTGFDSSDFVPEGLRAVIGKYATIKALAVVGDGLMAGFSSQSVSLDGLSESFSSTQSATSAYFGARIKQYGDEIKVWLTRNRYKFSPPPMSFTGA